MKITILAISDSDKHFSSAISEYTKRLGKSVTLLDIKPIKHGSKDQIIQKETDLLLKKLETRKKKWDSIYLLSKEWKRLTTQQIASILTPWSTITLVIWWPYGLDEPKIQPYINGSISLGNHTMPHWLAKLVLLEQIYRVQTIQAGRSYHY